MCKNNNIFIVNGRIRSDLYGKPTCKESSLIDYFIVASDLFPLISDFEVLDFDPLCSDIHCRLHVSIDYKSNLHNNNQRANRIVKPVRWNGDKSQQFIDNIRDRLSVNELFWS